MLFRQHLESHLRPLPCCRSFRHTACRSCKLCLTSTLPGDHSSSNAAVLRVLGCSFWPSTHKARLAQKRMQAQPDDGRQRTPPLARVVPLSQLPQPGLTPCLACSCWVCGWETAECALRSGGRVARRWVGTQLPCCTAAGRPLAQLLLRRCHAPLLPRPVHRQQPEHPKPCA